MKKLLSLLSLIVVMCMTTLQSHATVYIVADGYKWVKATLESGKTYTPSNVQYYDKDYFRTLILGGSVTYDKYKKTLTLDNASIYGSIWVIDEDLTIVLKGSSTIRPGRITDRKSSSGIRVANSSSKGYLRIVGENEDGLWDESSQLKIDVKDESLVAPAIQAVNTSVTIKNCDVKAYGNVGILGSNGSDLTVDFANVDAKGESASYPAIMGFQSFTTTSCRLETPESAKWGDCNGTNAVYTESNGSKVKVANVIYKHVDPLVLDEASLRCCGNEISLTNSATYTPLDGTGTISYDAHTQTLTLENVNYSSTVGTAISLQNMPLKVVLSGKNSLTAGYALYVKNDNVMFPVTIEGLDENARLVAKGADGAAFHLYKTLLTIKNCYVEARGKYGINGYKNGKNSENVDLIIDNAKVIAEGSSTTNADGSVYHYGSIVYLRRVELKECGLFLPTNARLEKYQYGTDYGVYYTDENGKQTEVSKAVTIAPGFIQIGSTKLATGTYTSAEIPEIVAGTITYDKATKELTLDNVTLNDIIRIEHNPTNICLKGDNQILASSSVNHTICIDNNETEPVNFYSQYKNNTVGSLTINVYGASRNFNTYETPITLTTCNLIINTIADNGWGIYAEGGKYTIDRAYLSVKGVLGAIYGLSELELKGCTMTPEGAKMGKDGYYSSNVLCDADGKIIKNSLVEIKPITYDINVGGEKVSAMNCDDILGDGMVEYDAESNTLILWDGATVSAPNGESAITATQDLNIAIAGKVTVEKSTNDRCPAITLAGGHNFTISKHENATAAELNIKSTFSGIHVEGTDDKASTLKCSFCTINIKDVDGVEALATGLKGNNNSKLEVDGAEIYYYSKRSGTPNPIYGFNSVELKGVEVIPAGYSYDADVKKFVDAEGNAATKSLRIAPVSYDITVASVSVNSQNRNDVLGDGTVQYDPVTNTLTLTNANIDAENTGIFAMRDLNVQFKGNNSIKVAINSAIHVMNGYTMTIMGEDKDKTDIYLTSNGKAAIAAYGDVVIKNCRIFGKGTYGIQGFGKGTLNVYDAILCLTATDGVPVNALKEQNLTDENIEYPTNCKWLTTAGYGYCVVDENYSAVTSYVILYQGQEENTIGRMAKIIEILNGRKVASLPADNVNEVGGVDMEDVKAIQESLLEEPTKGFCPATINGRIEYVHWVQLWAGGPKWAEMNLGATTKGVTGSYYMFGQTSETYYYSEDGDIQGTEYDTAQDEWGYSWQMPTVNDFEHLFSYCTYEWTTCYGTTGLSGYIFHGKGKYANNELFLPAAGQDGKDAEWGVVGYYYSSTGIDNSFLAQPLIFNKDRIYTSVKDRDWGYSIRPITK